MARVLLINMFGCDLLNASECANLGHQFGIEARLETMYV